MGVGALVKCIRELREKTRLHYPGLKRVTVSATRQEKDEAELQKKIQEAMCDVAY